MGIRCATTEELTSHWFCNDPVRVVENYVIDQPCLTKPHRSAQDDRSAIGSLYLFIADFLEGDRVVHFDIIHLNLDTVLLSFVPGYFQFINCTFYDFPLACPGGPHACGFLKGSVEYGGSLALGSVEVYVARRKSEAIFRVTPGGDDMQPAGRGVSEVQIANKMAHEERLLYVLLTEVRIGWLTTDEHSSATITPSTVRT